MGRTTRTCSLALALALTSLAASAAEGAFVRSGASTFVAARAAADAGDARRAAMLYASLSAAEPANGVIASRALAQAIIAGDMELALRLAKSRRTTELTPDARLLLVADQLRSGAKPAAVVQSLPTELPFFAPVLQAWSLAERGQERQALAALDTVPADSLLAPVVAEHRALLLLKAGDAAAAQRFIPEAVRRAGGRADRLRIAFAYGLAGAGAREAGLALLADNDVVLRRAAQQLAAERRPKPLIDTAPQAFAELLNSLVVTLGRQDGRALPIALTQVSRFADRSNPQTAILLALLLGDNDRGDDALAVLRSLPESSPFLSEARDAEIRILLRSDRRNEALARAQAFVTDPEISSDDWARLGDVLDTANRHVEAAEAYGKALALVEAEGAGSDAWSLHLLRGAAFEQADRWPEAEASLEAAHRLAPDNPVVLNYLGYARLERGEQLDEAEALIARASSLAPNDASIADSLGWAQFKRGKLSEAIATLQRAAAADPAEAEIHEHLGDALYTAGRKYEARFAWNAALVSAEDDVKGRIEAKLERGLTKDTAAP